MRLRPYRRHGSGPKIGLNANQKFNPCLFKIGGGKTLAVESESIQRALDAERGFDVVCRGPRINVVIIIRVELDQTDIALESGDRPRAGILLAPAPDQIETSR